jgi:arsenate reductase (thioredoxin)
VEWVLPPHPRLLLRLAASSAERGQRNTEKKIKRLGEFSSRFIHGAAAQPNGDTFCLCGSLKRWSWTMEKQNPIHVLFLCTHNSARSILAEAILNHLGGERFKAYSAGSNPRDNQQPNPFAIQALQGVGISTKNLYSKSWDEFSKPDSPAMDLIITVCDNAAGESCPFWPGNPASAHWGYADPSITTGTNQQKLAAFEKTMFLIRRRLDLFLNLPFASLDKVGLQTKARELAAA